MVALMLVETLASLLHWNAAYPRKPKLYKKVKALMQYEPEDCF
jgi:hypothetical protein